VLAFTFERASGAEDLLGDVVGRVVDWHDEPRLDRGCADAGWMGAFRTELRPRWKGGAALRTTPGHRRAALGTELCARQALLVAADALHRRGDLRRPPQPSIASGCLTTAGENPKVPAEQRGGPRYG
jgi:hypothetical protein